MIGQIFYTTSSFVHHFKSIGEFKLNLQTGNAQFGSNCRFFVLCDLDIWWMTLENNRTPLQYYIKLCASFQSHRWIQTGVTVQKRSIRVKIGNFLSRVTLQFDVWSWKTIGHLFYVALSSESVHHFIAISEFKLTLELQSGNAQFGSKSIFFVPCDLEIWQMTLKNNRAHLLCCFKLYASFRSHWWIHTGDTVRKRPIWVTIDDFLVVWPWNLTDDSYVNSNWSYGPETAKLGVGLCDLDLWPMTLTFCMDLTFVIGNNSWKFHDGTMIGTYIIKKVCQTDGQTDGLNQS